MPRRLDALCLAFAFVLAACAPRPDTPPPWQTQEPEPEPEPEVAEPEPEPGPVRVGLLLPLSGDAEALGNDMLRAAQMALFDVGDNPVELLPRDTRGTTEGAREAARAVLDDGAELILGPLFGRNASAIAPIARQRDVAVLTFSSDSSVAEPRAVYVLGFRPEEQVERVVGYAVERGHGRIAALASDDAYGSTVLGALRRTLEARLDGELGPVRTYAAGEDDLAPLLRDFAGYDRRREALQEERRRLAARGDDAAREMLAELQARDTLGDLPFDAVLLPEGGGRLRQVASLLAFYDVDPREVRFLGTQRWDEDRGVFDEPALRGGWYAAPPPGGVERFARQFERTFGQIRSETLAVLAYDATAIAAVLSHPRPDYSHETITDRAGFSGATGVFRLRSDGLVERALAVLEVHPDGPRVVDPAPSEFEDVVALR